MFTPPSYLHLFDDFFPVATETIMLSTTSIQWAQHVCRDIADADEQWHSFLRALAIAGFEQWLQQGNMQLPIRYAHNMAPNTDVNIQVGDFHLCILPMGTFQDDRVSIPATAINGDYAAHLYVLVEVHEEIEQVRVVAGLRADRLGAYARQQQGAGVAEDYVVPVSQFTVSPEKLLLYLSCLQPDTILETTDRVTSGIDKSIANQLNETVTAVINTGKWLQGQLDTVAEQLAWQLIPSLEPSYGFRGNNPLEKVPTILEELRQRGVDVPGNAAGACKVVGIGDAACELYTLVWALPESQEWSLFVLLGPEDNGPLPAGLELQVSDEMSVLSKSEIRQDAAMTYLYIQAIGNLDEQFMVEMNASDNEKVKLPPFRFDTEM